MEVNTAGHLEFTMSAYHPYYNIIKPLKSTIEVYEDDKLIWFGRPVDIHIDFYKQKKVYCEGALSFFNDTIQRPNTYEDFSLHSFFSDLIELHNMGVSTASRRFKVGNITVDDKTVYRELKYESTYDAIQHMCLDTDGGYLFFRREGNKNYIDWLKEMPYTCNQPIQFALNLLDYGSEFDGSDLATCLIPLGSDDLTIETVNGGSDVLVTEAANEYGEITKVQRYSDITDASELKREGQKFLEDSQFNSSTIECSAADLHSINGEYEQFVLGQMVHCISEPHLVDKYFPLSKMSIKLDSAAKEITLGTIKRKTLTRIYKQQTDTTDQDYGYDDDYGYDPSVFTDDNGDPWVLVPPEKDGDPVSAVKLPTHITVAKPPNKINYKNSDTIDFIGLVVNIWCGDKLWTGDGHSAYKDGHAPLRELSFSSKKATLMPTVTEMNQTIVVTWKYKGKEYKTSFKINVSKGGRNILDRMYQVHPGSKVFFRKYMPEYGETPEMGDSYFYNDNSIILYECVVADHGQFYGGTLATAPARIHYANADGGYPAYGNMTKKNTNIYYHYDTTRKSTNRGYWNSAFPVIPIADIEQALN